MKWNVFVARDSQITDLLDRIAARLSDNVNLHVHRGPMPPSTAKFDYQTTTLDIPFDRFDVAVLSNNTLCDHALMASGRRLRGIVYPAVGVDSLDLQAAHDAGLIVGHGAVPENAQGMAEATLLLILSLCLQLRRSEELLRTHSPRPSAEQNWVRQLKGKIVGIIGFGRIAKTLTQLLRPIGVKVLVHHPSPKDVPSDIAFVSMEELLRSADFVTLHVTLTEQTRGLISARELAWMKPTAYLINTSRGAVVDEAALVDSLEGRKIAGAALDTFEVEPLPLSSALRSMSNVILTPHMVGQTREAFEALVFAAEDNVARILQEQLPRHCKNPVVEPQWRKRLIRLNETEL